MIAQKASFAFFSNLIKHGLGFISLFFVARFMGPEALGIIAFALAYVHLFNTFSDLGFGTAHIKRVSEGKDFGRCNGTYFTVRSCLTIIMALIVLSTILVPKLFRNQVFVSRNHEIVLYLILLSSVLNSISMMIIITLGARRETAKQSVPLVVEKIVVVSGKVFVALMGFGVVFLAATNLLGAGIALICFILIFRGYPLKKPNKAYFVSYFKFAIPVMLIGFLSDIAHNMDKVLIQFFWTAGDVGYYSAAERIAVIIRFIVIASGTLIFPTMSAYHASGRIGAIRNISMKAERYLSMVILPILGFILVFANDIAVNFLGKSFQQSSTLLVILAAVVLVNGMGLAYSQQLGATNRIVLAAKISSVIFVFDILLNFLFIPKNFIGIPLLGLGGYGAALSTLLSMILGTCLFRIYAYKISGSKPNLRVLLHLLSAFIMVCVLKYLSGLVLVVNWFYLISFFFIGLAIYFLLLRILGEFKNADWQLFLKIVNPVYLGKYALEEIKTGYTPSEN